MVLDDAVSLDHGILRNLRAVAHRWDGIFIKAGNHAGVTIDLCAVAHPHVVEFVSLEDRVVEDFGAVLDKGKIHHRLAVDLRLVHNARLADGRLIVDLQDLVMVRRQPFGGNDNAIVQNAGVAVEMALAPHAGLLNGDVVTYSRPVADLCAVQPAAVTDTGIMAHDARQGKTRVAGHGRSCEHHAVFVVDPTFAVLREGALIVNPAASRPDSHVVKVRRGDNLPQRSGVGGFAVFPLPDAGFVAEAIFVHLYFSDKRLH